MYSFHKPLGRGGAVAYNESVMVIFWLPFELVFCENTTTSWWICIDLLQEMNLVDTWEISKALKFTWWKKNPVPAKQATPSRVQEEKVNFVHALLLSVLGQIFKQVNLIISFSYYYFPLSSNVSSLSEYLLLYILWS